MDLVFILALFQKLRGLIIPQNDFSFNDEPYARFKTEVASVEQSRHAFIGLFPLCNYAEVRVEKVQIED